MVEFALILPLLLLLLLGVVELGYNLYNAQSLRQGTSTATRNAAVLSNPPGTCATSAPAGPTRDVVCDVKDRTGLTDAQVAVVVSEGWTRGAAVVVCSQRQSESLTGFIPFLANTRMTSRTEYRIEREGDDTPVEFFEPGGDWSWCR